MSKDLSDKNICVCGVGILQPDGTLCHLENFGEFYKIHREIIGDKTRDMIEWFENSDAGILCTCKSSQSFIAFDDMGVSQDKLIDDVEKILKKADGDTLKHIRGRINAKIEKYPHRHLFLKESGRSRKK